MQCHAVSVRPDRPVDIRRLLAMDLPAGVELCRRGLKALGPARFSGRGGAGRGGVHDGGARSERGDLNASVRSELCPRVNISDC